MQWKQAPGDRQNGSADWLNKAALGAGGTGSYLKDGEVKEFTCSSDAPVKGDAKSPCSLGSEAGTNI